MGLDRVADVRSRMAATLACPVVTVTGTNGKGSTCALLEAMLHAAGHRTGMYTSPHLLTYNERVRIDATPATDDALVAAFNAVEDARADVPLTYFEFGTLAAFWLFARANLAAAILEVGLGGRLDAVNVIDADVAVVTSVDLDHMDYLGPTREDIGREKAGIFRAGRPAVCGEPNPPATLLAQARVLGTPLTLIGRDYGFVAGDSQWNYWGPGGRRHGLPVPALRGTVQLANAASAIATLDLLRERVHVDAGALRTGLVSVELPGRLQVLPGRPTIVLDVAHNPHAARALATALATMGFHPRTIAVFGMLADKDVDGVAAAMSRRIDRWNVATLPGARGARATAVGEALLRAGIATANVRTFDDVASAYRAARDDADEADRIVVFGSFLTVAAALAVDEGERETRHG
jgi:dihydrofolate synthase/folylpolyglutamate synthase